MITYQVHVADGHAHRLRVRVVVPRPATQQVVSLPVWIPGSYLVREFARHLCGLQARQGTQVCEVVQLDKATWQVACKGRQNLVLSYEVYAFDTSVRAAFLSASRCFLNGTSVCLRVHSQGSVPCRLQLTGVPRGWQILTAMSSDTAPHTYLAAHYDELVDHPIEMGTFWLGQFKARGVVHEVAVTGAWPDFDGPRLLRDMRRICETQIAFWHGPKAKPPFKRYVFMLHAVEDGYGGLEHRASTALMASRRDLPARGRSDCTEGYVTLLGLISHEYFHTWNVKRLRPAAFESYDYTQENYTELLWFFEGFTSYYDDLFLLRSGCIDGPRYLQLLAKTVSQVLATPGRQVQSLAQASFDAWVKYYRMDENTPNSGVSYYTKGALVALALDLTLRSQGSGSLDGLMQRLWQRSQGGPIAYDDIAAELCDMAGASMVDTLQAWVYGCADLPLQTLLTHFGIVWQHSPPNAAGQLGLRVSESALTGVKVTSVLTDGAAQRAGLAVGDELLGMAHWRLRRLDDALRWVEPGQKVPICVGRDQRVLHIDLTWPQPTAQAGAVTLTPQVQAKLCGPAEQWRQAWWGG